MLMKKPRLPMLALFSSRCATKAPSSLPSSVAPVRIPPQRLGSNPRRGGALRPAHTG